LINLVVKLFAPIIKRIQRARLRQMMRGYRYLKKSNRLGCITAIKQELTVQTFKLSPEFFSSTIMGASLHSSEVVLRQYLLLRIGGLNLNQALLTSAGKPAARVVFPMPSQWRDVVERHGFVVNRFRSALRWQLFVLGLWMLGVAKATRILLDRKTTVSLDFEKSYAYFADLVPSNLPREVEGTKSKCIISWYLDWQGRSAEIKSLRHSVASSPCRELEGFEVVMQRGPLPSFSSFRERVQLLLWMTIASMLAAFDILRGRWWHAVLLNQAALAAQARIVKAESLAKEYLFHNSNWIYCPMWTYEAQKSGSSILFYFYSTNVQFFNNASRSVSAPYGWKASNWPHYLVWDQYQVDFLREAVGGSPEISVVGAIWFEDSPTGELCVSDNTVAVFDVQPHRDSRYQALALEYEYYVPETAVQFLADIHSVISELKLDMAFKKKREIKKIAHPRYRNLLKSLEGESHITFVSPTNSASRLIEKCFAVISMPFTSTALLGHLQGKPSVYYDPNGGVLKGDCAAHGIEIVIGKDELRAWLLKVMADAVVSPSPTSSPVEVLI
jgi:polysaccharide biosynthesis PFTS motif protein